MTCNSIDKELEDAADWMTRYAAKFSGEILTNFDEQMPRLAGAPPSYQKLSDHNTIYTAAGDGVIGSTSNALAGTGNTYPQEFFIALR